MASEIDLSDWILKNFDEGKINITQLSWPCKVNISLFDFRVSILYKGSAFVGRGTDQNKQLALEKATSEAIEKYLFFELNLKSTCGLALHPNKVDAQINSKYEILERDLFLSYFYTNEPLFEFNYHSPMFAEIEKIALDLGWYFRFFILNAKESIFTVMCAIEGPGIFLGLSTKNITLGDAILHAAVEAIRNWVHDIFFKNLNRKNLPTYDSFLELPTAETHGDFYLSEPNYMKIKKIFHTKTSILPQREYPRVHTLQVDLNRFELTNGLKISCSFSESSDAQNFFFGLPNENNINIVRLKKFTKNINFNFSMLTKYPHPFR